MSAANAIAMDSKGSTLAIMLWQGTSLRELNRKAAAFRRVHERWLDRAIRSGMDLPRIPLRRVDQGGFDDLLARPRGREVAWRWWRRVFSRLPDGE